MGYFRRFLIHKSYSKCSQLVSTGYVLVGFLVLSGEIQRGNSGFYQTLNFASHERRDSKKCLQSCSVEVRSAFFPDCKVDLWWASIGCFMFGIIILAVAEFYCVGLSSV